METSTYRTLAILSWAYACEKIVWIIGDELCFAVIEPVFILLTGLADKHIFLLLCLFGGNCLYYFHILNQIFKAITNTCFTGFFKRWIAFIRRRRCIAKGPAIVFRNIPYTNPIRLYLTANWVRNSNIRDHRDIMNLPQPLHRHLEGRGGNATLCV